MSSIFNTIIPLLCINMMLEPLQRNVNLSTFYDKEWQIAVHEWQIAGLNPLSFTVNNLFSNGTNSLALVPQS